MNIADQQKQNAAEQALAYVENGMIIGVGTGSTVNFFIEALKKIKNKIEGAVSSSRASTERLRAAGIPLVDLNSVSALPIYVDGADEVNEHHYMIKGGGGALTQEKIVAAVSKKFICVVSADKVVSILGKFPLPVEVIPMARSYVAREIVKLGGNPVYRVGFITDNGNAILDVHGMHILDPIALEQKLNQIAGVVTNGIFAIRKADVVLIGKAS